MKKKGFSIIFSMLSGCFFVQGQVTITIDSIMLHSVIETRERDERISPFGEGPGATMTISIKNEQSSPLIISKHDGYRLFCMYSRNGFPHRSLDMYLSLREGQPLSIQSGCTLTESLSVSLFLPAIVYNMDDIIVYDHIPMLEEALSSICLVLEIDGKRYESHNNPVILKGVFF